MLTELYSTADDVIKKLNQNNFAEPHLSTIQTIINKLSMIISGFGTQYLPDLLFIGFGADYTEMKMHEFNDSMKQKMDLLNQFVSPIGYKIINWKNGKNTETRTNILCSNKIVEHIIYVEDSNTLECFDIDKPSTSSLYQKIYGVQIAFQNEQLKKTLIVSGIIEDIEPEWISNEYIRSRREQLNIIGENLIGEDKPIFNRIIKSLSLKDLLIFGNDDIMRRIYSIHADITKIKKNRLDITIKTFLEMDCFSQRAMIINILNYNNDIEIQYITNILYGFIDINKIDNADNKNLQILNDSLPWTTKTRLNITSKEVKQQMSDAVNKYEEQTVSLEQQILLLKVSDSVKEKAMHKLKELKNRSEESSIKTKQYLEGLVRIPFGVYKEEPLLKTTKDVNARVITLLKNIEKYYKPAVDTPIKEKYTNAEIYIIVKKIHSFFESKLHNEITNRINECTLNELTMVINLLNSREPSKKTIKPATNKQTKVSGVVSHLNDLSRNDGALKEIYDKLYIRPLSMKHIFAEISAIETILKTIENDMSLVVGSLDASIHGHKHAKNQILKIIGQWMNGEQSGYCFGFEGSPGIGKTSLAKNGISNCLKDEFGIKRPFAFIALGGASNGSTLEGHGYTYMNSTWGKIVDVVMETKCMNPIIYIDELDKVSKTENGKEIIGILINMIDSTQSAIFQDKYFTGIDIDLSKVLFIFSYNDPEQIDKILLDRIHRIRFDNLSVEDKLVVCNDFILPDINAKMGFQDTINIDNNTLKHIIENYTREPGVRKLKEILFDIYGEINIELLKTDKTDCNITIPIQLTEELIEEKYVNKYNKNIPQRINDTSEVGLVNALWANSLGMGGIMPVQTLFFPTDHFLELKLTGLQGDVMKESMNVAKTLAWHLSPDTTKKRWIKFFKETRCQGIHIHCPEGAVSKDGPSAGAAITVSIYSLLNNKRIKNTIGLTGEITLNGMVTQIGGLDSKVLGGIKGGIKTFLYPGSNQKDLDDFLKIYNNNP
jgi:ATP-dependent Lon protease